jgi:hypothetical protein
MPRSIVIRTVESATVAQLDTLEDIQAAVGGSICLVPSPESVRGCLHCFRNEDGEELGLPRNRRAEDFFEDRLGMAHVPIFGNVVLLGAPKRNDVDGKCTDVPQWLIEGVIIRKAIYDVLRYLIKNHARDYYHQEPAQQQAHIYHSVRHVIRAFEFEDLKAEDASLAALRRPWH